MRLMVLQFVNPVQDEPLAEFSNDLGILSALLKADGFDCSLTALGGYRKQLLDAAVEQHRPDVVLAELTPYSITAAHRTIVDLAQQHSLPVVVCGAYATCRADQAVSIPGVRALALGEYQQSLVELLRAWRDGGPVAGIKGLWVHVADGWVKNPPADLLEDLDSLPHADREIFDYARIVRETGELHFKAARGCPQWCAFCVNDWYMDLYAGCGRFVRRRSVGHLLDEVAAVRARYDGAGSVTFYDHCFAMDADWLAEFAAEYPRRCSLPYRCCVSLDLVNEATAAMLSDSLCRSVHVRIGSGSRFIREEVLSMHVADEQIVDACRVLRQAGLRVSAEVFVGCPYESQITVEETLSLVRRCEADQVAARVYYPAPGTRAAELCAENGWTTASRDEDFWAQRSVLNMPSMPAEHIDAVARNYSYLLGHRRPGAMRKVLGKARRRRR